jgi:hypothetical protein
MLIAIKALVVALVSELSFVIALVIGGIISVLAALAVTAVRGYARLTRVRAVLQGVVTGLVAGAAGLWVAIELGRSLSVPDSWLLWLAAIPPILGEFGDFWRRFYLQYIGRPDTGVFVPLGRLHGAAKHPLWRSTFEVGLVVFRENDPEDVPVLAASKAYWFIGWMSWGLVIGAITSMWWIAEISHITAR